MRVDITLKYFFKSSTIIRHSLHHFDNTDTYKCIVLLCIVDSVHSLAYEDEQFVSQYNFNKCNP